MEGGRAGGRQGNRRGGEEAGGGSVPKGGSGDAIHSPDSGKIALTGLVRDDFSKECSGVGEDAWRSAVPAWTFSCMCGSERGKAALAPSGESRRRCRWEGSNRMAKRAAEEEGGEEGAEGVEEEADVFDAGAAEGGATWAWTWD